MSDGRLSAGPDQRRDKEADTGAASGVDCWNGSRADPGVTRTAEKSGVALTAIVTLTLAVAANVTVFALLNALLLRDAPVPHPEQLAVLTTSNPGFSYEGGLTFALFEQFQHSQSVFSSVIGWSDVGVYNIQTGQEDTHGSCALVTGRFYSELGARPARGRLITDSDVN